MRILDRITRGKQSIHGHAIPIGTAFYGDLTSGLMLRTYGSIVDLENPANTWGGRESEPKKWPTVGGYWPVDARVVVDGELNGKETKDVA
jgi:hypothetical protein